MRSGASPSPSLSLGFIICEMEAVYLIIAPMSQWSCGGSRDYHCYPGGGLVWGAGELGFSMGRTTAATACQPRPPCPSSPPSPPGHSSMARPSQCPRRGALRRSGKASWGSSAGGTYPSGDHRQVFTVAPCKLRPGSGSLTKREGWRAPE